LYFNCALLVFAQANDAAPVDSAPKPIAVSVSAGVPLRVVATEKIRFRKDQTVHARVVEPVFAFDREVIPAGSELIGSIKGLKPVSGRKRAAAILGGDFTPLHEPEIEFDTLVLNDGRRIPVQTLVTPGGGAVVRFKGASPRKRGTLAAAKQAAHDQIDGQKRALIEAVKAPGKLQRASDTLLARLPYHPQSWPTGTRLNAQLLSPLDFGAAAVPRAELSQLGAQPERDSVVHARLITSLNSRSAAKGMTVEALLSQPLFSLDHHLLFPEGSRLCGTVVQVRPARLWHRNGQLRFAFQSIEPALTVTESARDMWRVEGQLESVEVGGKEKITMDSEGGTKVTSSKTRFIAPAVTVMLAAGGLDQDPVRSNGVPTGAIQSNAAGQALAGGVGFGLIGMGLGQISRPVAAAIGFYGAGWSIYSNVVGRGQEVQFPAETAIEVRFGSRVGPKQ
jgi:hypothetical protein